MTLDEKLSMVHGAATGLSDPGGPIYTGLVRANKRLCIPQLGLADGAAGVAGGFGGVTQLPAPVAMAATWDRSFARGYGDVIGAEDRGKGANIALGPTVDVVRDPRAGRAFETLGEDPFLTSRLAIQEIRAIQSHGVIAQAKHFAAYTQETFRASELDDAIVDERTLQEIYLPPFEAAVTAAGVGSVMCSYNFLNGVQACSHPYLLNQVLKGQWGFRGFVTSDWFALHNTAPAANAGLDQQMPDDCYFGPELKTAIQSGKVSRSRLDDMVRRILRQAFRFGLFDRRPSGSPDARVTNPRHAAFSRALAEQGTVLLKNSRRTLPLNPKRLRSIAVIGAAGGERAMTAGGGSGHVIPPYVVTPIEGIRKRAGSRVEVTFDDGTNPAQAAVVAASADVAIVVAALLEGEFKDLTTIDLFPTDNALIEAVVRANPNTIVVINSGSAVTMPWLGRVKGVLEAWYPGQEYGNALAAILFGDVNPSAKLPVTFPTSLRQVPANTPMRWPGVGHVEFSEGLAVGYRWYDESNLTPLFPFGFGLSYTRFRFDHLSVRPRATPIGNVSVEVDITNTGARRGAEVVQLYLTHPARDGEPPKLLKGFEKVQIEPGQTKHVRFSLDARALSHWDTGRHRWVASAGRYTVRIGNSSRHLPLSAAFRLPRTLITSRATPKATRIEAPPITDPVDRFTSCQKDFLAPFINASFSVAGNPMGPLDVLGRPVP